MIHDQINQDLKKALLEGDSFKATVLRGLKSAIGYAEVAAGKREEGLPDQEIVSIFQKESKKRQESADMYSKAGDQERASSELKEKEIISEYLPAELTEDEISSIIDEVIVGFDTSNMSAMGQIIGAVKDRAGGAVDGALVARLVKGRLQ